MKKAIGIDLGTTNSVVGFKGTAVKIIRNKENDELTKSCVGLRRDEILVGRNAFQLLKTDPINTILSVKRLMGGAIKDKMVQEMINSSYYKFAITHLKGGTDDAVAVLLGGKQFTPEQVSAEILKKIKSDAEEKLGDEVSHAVITVPAYFTEKQKNATRVAARLAGLKVQKLLAEPTAAAIAYGVDSLKPGDSKTVLIYDFGGGTFDLSILNIVDGQYLEAGTGGDRWLGGDDLDRKLQEFVIQKVSTQYGIKDLHSLVRNLSDKKRFVFDWEIRVQSEAAKIQLSSAKTASIIIDNLLEDENGDSIDIDVTISREEFEKLATPFVQKSIELINALLKEVGYDIGMIDSILLVGGTSCIPIVKQLLSEKFGADKIKMSEKPMLAVAEGAAILSHRLGDEFESGIDQANSIGEISYSTNHTYFIELKDGELFPIIEKQMPMPVNILKTFKTTTHNQKIVEIVIYADVEGGRKEKQTMGFYTIEENLPSDSELVFDIILNIDELFEVQVYPKANKSKIKKIVLGRGYKDSRALEFLSKSFQKMLSNNYSEKQKDYFFKAAQKEIETINSLGTCTSDSEKWEQVGTNTFSAFEQAERVTEEIDEDQLTIIFAQILLNEYPDLIGSEDATAMRRLSSEIKTDDALARIQAAQKLKVITDEYPVLITLFTIKIASESAAKTNPSDAHRLLQMHDQIVRHFRNRQKDEAFALINEALDLRNQYDPEDFTSVSIHLKK